MELVSVAAPTVASEICTPSDARSCLVPVLEDLAVKEGSLVLLAPVVEGCEKELVRVRPSGRVIAAGDCVGEGAVAGSLEGAVRRGGDAEAVMVCWGPPRRRMRGMVCVNSA